MQLPGLVEAGGFAQELPVLIVGFLAAAIAGYLCIKYLLRYLRHGSLYIFAAYCAAIGIATLILGAIR